MILTRASEYAIRCVLFLATRQPGEVVSRRTISREMGIPTQFLSKIAQRLAQVGLIEIRQGAKGGYLLARPPEDVSLLDVIEAVEGEIFLNQCLMRADFCARTVMCPVHQVWQEAREELRRVLGGADFGRLGRLEMKANHLSYPGGGATGADD
jgi:Rrf2 family iron-sulfur cluster assembly transcriptional regulator